jgi:hypothetical protein
VGGERVVGRVVVADEVGDGVGGRGCPGATGREEEERAALDVAPAGDEVGEVADAELELEVGGYAEVEDVCAEEAGDGIVDVGQHVRQLASALLGCFEIGIEDVLAGCGGDEAELFASWAGLSHCSSLSWL